jgi:hypothetical protein
MLADVFSAAQFIHLFPSFFAILLCVVSRFDHLWIDAKVRSDLTTGAAPNPPLIAAATQLANGAAALNIYLVNVLLFFAGAILAVFDWPRCQVTWPLTVCIILFAVILYDLFILGVRVRFDSFDRDPLQQTTVGFPPLRWLRNLPPSKRLRWEQIAFNVIIIALVVAGALLGGSEDTRGVCKSGDHHAGKQTLLRYPLRVVGLFDDGGAPPIAWGSAPSAAWFLAKMRGGT